MKKIIAFSGSNHSRSINQKLVHYTAKLIDNDQVEVLDLRNFAPPMFSIDLEKEKGIPAAIQQLKQKFEEADGFIISSPEHNGSTPAFFKNIIDWLSRMDQNIFGNKPVLLMSTSPGSRGGRSNLEHLSSLMPRWGALITGHYSLSKFRQNMDEAGNHLQQEEHEKLKAAVDQLVASLREVRVSG